MEFQICPECKKKIITAAPLKIAREHDGALLEFCSVACGLKAAQRIREEESPQA